VCSIFTIISMQRTSSPQSARPLPRFWDERPLTSSAMPVSRPATCRNSEGTVERLVRHRLQAARSPHATRAPARPRACALIHWRIDQADFSRNIGGWTGSANAFNMTRKESGSLALKIQFSENGMHPRTRLREPCGFSRGILAVRAAFTRPQNYVRLRAQS
jgi:hypothetical protein